MNIKAQLISAAILTACLAAPARADVMLGQIDTFEDGTTQGWTVAIAGIGSHPAPPVNVPTGGPGGVDDNYLQLTALGGGGSGSKLSVLNLDQWAGDYIDAGVTLIEFDVRNFGPDDVALRLVFEDPAGGPPSNIAVTSDVALVAAGGDWTHVRLTVDAASLVAVLGDATSALENATVLRLIHNPAADFPGPPIGPPAVNVILGVDNILASAVPEPSTLALAIIGSFGMLGVAWKRRRAAKAA